MADLVDGGTSVASVYDFGAMSDKLSRVADDLRKTSDGLRQAVDGVSELSWTAEAVDGSVRVVADGRGRIAELYLSPYLLRRDPAAVGESVAAAVNDALSQARTGRQQALLDRLSPALGGTVEETVDQARREADR